MAGLNLQGIVLPPYAREDLAWGDTLIGTNAAIHDRANFKVPGEWVLVPTVLTCFLTTDANPAARNLNFVALNGDGGVIFQLTAPNTQPASVLTVYTAVPGGGAVYTVGNAAQVFALPSVALLSTYTLSVQINSVQAGDVLSVSLTGIKVPTGPPLAGAGTVLPTPLALGG